ncbi:TcaA NTF2-like domain-containing protein [Falsibacillus pallidus]|uniref:TcaA NTF2-like domain-containing protein n=1 Tax=Falsibacillus pallidus TaxID=493781 RepID=UPI003D968F15
MKEFFNYIAIGMMIIGLLGIFACTLLALISLLKRNMDGFIKILGAGALSVVVLIIGLVLGTFTEKNYWERAAGDSDDKENEEIIKNIQRNEEAARQAYEEDQKAQKQDYENWLKEVDAQLDDYDEKNVYNTVLKYESAITDAINQGDFSIVEPYLLPDSTLYSSQIELVENLHNKGITETLNMFNIESINKVEEGIFAAEVYEEVQINYSNGKTENKNFKWTYTIHNADGQYLLSDLQ